MKLPAKLIRRLSSRSEAGKKDPLLLAYASETHIIALFTLLGLLAKSDGYVSKEEIAPVQRFIELQVPEELHGLAKQAFRDGKKAEPVRGTITKHAFTLYWEPSHRWLEPLQVVDILLRVALADRTFSDWEDYIIETVRLALGIHVRTYLILRDTIAEQLGVSLPGQEQSFARAKDWNVIHKVRRRSQDAARENGAQATEPTRIEEAKKTLGVGPNPTPDEVRQAYRKLVKRYHPDANGSATTTDNQRKSAIEMFLQVQEAYEILMTK